MAEADITPKRTGKKDGRTQYQRALQGYTIRQHYKLVQEAPLPGIYILPSLDNISIWHGVFFVPTNYKYYEHAIIKFLMRFPKTFPNAGPRVYMRTKIFHPLVNATTGEVDLSPEIPLWNPKEHTVLNIISYVDKILRNCGIWETTGRPVRYASSPSQPSFFILSQFSPTNNTNIRI